MNLMAQDTKTCALAMNGIKASKLYDALKEEILKTADLRTRKVPRAHQVSLMKLGKYTDDGWELLSRSMSEYVDLASPASIRRVCSFHFVRQFVLQ
jgi:hypothetical protein